MDETAAALLATQLLAPRGNNTYMIPYECGTGNDYDGRLGLRIGSIFVIGAGSLLGALAPIAAARTKRMHVPPVAFFIAKYLGSGVIVGTAFIHLLAPAQEALGSPCLTGAITSYSWATGIAMMSIFMMFLIELITARFDIFGHDKDHALEHNDPSHTVMARHEKPHEHQNNIQHDVMMTTAHQTSQTKHQHQHGHGHEHQDTRKSHESATEQSADSSSSLEESGNIDLELGQPSSRIPGRPDDLSYPPGGEDHLGHQREHEGLEDAQFAPQMTGLAILEFGVIFHSIFIGLTLAVAGSNFNILFIVLSFHQTLEGLGLGTRLATANWPKSKKWLPWVFGSAYGLTTPLSIAVGLAVRATLQPGSNKMLIINGVFDAISAGILIYTGLVELMAHEFMFNQEMRKSSIKMMLSAFGCMCVGAGLMGVLGKWA